MVFLSTLTFFSKIMEEKRKSVLKEKWEKEEMWKKYVPYVVQRKHFDQTFSKSLMVQVHEGAKASKRRGGAQNKYPPK